MTKTTQMRTAALVGFVLFLILAHPATLVMPAPGAKNPSPLALLALALVLVFALALSRVIVLLDHAEDAPILGCDRLALNCLLRC